MLNTKRERPEFELDRVDVLKLRSREVKGLEGNYEHEVKLLLAIQLEGGRERGRCRS